MKKNLGTFFGLSRCGVGAVLLGLCAFTPVSRADVIINNMPPGETTLAPISGATVGQVFTMSSPNGSGTLSSLTLELYSTSGGIVNVDLYNAPSGAPTGSAILLGTVTAGTSGNQAIGVSSLNHYSLAVGTQYAIVLEQSGSVSWDFTSSTASLGYGTLGTIYTSVNSGVTWGAYGGSGGMQMNLQTTPVPEVPMTGVVMGFGALAIALGRKLRPNVSSIA